MVNETGSSETTARSSAGVVVWTLFSRAVGLARVLVIGAVLGPTYVANVFQAGFVLPSNAFTVLAGPVLAMVVVPAVVGVISVSDGGDMHAARLLLSRLTGRLLRLAMVGTVLLALASPVLAWTLVASAPATLRGHAWLLGIVLILFVCPQVLLYTVAELGVAAQQARGRFGLAAAAPAAESLGTIVTVVLAGRWFGTGLDAAHTPNAMMIVLGVGTTLSVAVHAGIQAHGAARVGLLVLPRWDWRADPTAVDAVRRIGRSVPVAAAPAVTNYLLAVVAATVPGGVLLVQLSYQVFYAVSFLGGRAVAMVALPRLAAAAHAEDQNRFASAWRDCLFYAVVAATLPLALLALFAEPIADLLTNGALHRGPVIVELAGCLLIAAFAQLVGGLHDLGRQALFAALDDRGPRIASGLALGMVVAVAAACLLLPPQGARLPGLVGALFAGELVAAVFVLARLRRALRPHPLITGRDGGAWARTSVIMAPALLVGWWVLRRHHPTRLGEFLVLAVSALLALAALVAVLSRSARQQAGDLNNPGQS